MRLVEQLVEEGSGDFTVDAATPARAAAMLLRAHDAARAQDSNRVSLPDGQSRHIEPRTIVENRVFCVLLDGAGQETGGEVEPEHKQLAADANRREHDGQDGCAPAQASIPEPKP
jgi:hypothetical protein